jgi:predicted ribosome quality control (RQC) complex YloA/Tae2 family protein
MKVKLNRKQIEVIRRELKETERRNFKTEDVSEVFKMLQYWGKSVGRGEAKIKTVAELPGGYLCRVNSTFREMMKAYIKQIRKRKAEEHLQTKQDREMQDNADRYDQLIREAEEGSSKPRGLH